RMPSLMVSWWVRKMPASQRWAVAPHLPHGQSGRWHSVGAGGGIEQVGLVDPLLGTRTSWSPRFERPHPPPLGCSSVLATNPRDPSVAYGGRHRRAGRGIRGAGSLSPTFTRAPSP